MRKVPQFLDQSADQDEERSYDLQRRAIEGQESVVPDTKMGGGDVLRLLLGSLIGNAVDPKRKAGAEYAAGYENARREKIMADAQKKKEKVDKNTQLLLLDAQRESRRAERKRSQAGGIRQEQQFQTKLGEDRRQFDVSSGIEMEKVKGALKKQEEDAKAKLRDDEDRAVKEFRANNFKLYDRVRVGGGAAVSAQDLESLKAEREAILERYPNIDRRLLPDLPTSQSLKNYAANEKKRMFEENLKLGREKFAFAKEIAPQKLAVSWAAAQAALQNADTAQMNGMTRLREFYLKEYDKTSGDAIKKNKEAIKAIDVKIAGLQAKRKAVSGLKARDIDAQIAELEGRKAKHQTVIDETGQERGSNGFGEGIDKSGGAKGLSSGQQSTKGGTRYQVVK